MKKCLEKGYIIVVTYNRKQKLEKCIKCLLSQTYSFDKIIVVNNASSDGTDQFLEKLSKQNEKVSYYTSKENEGGAGGFCKAIELAYNEGADWIWGMDDDAFPEYDALEKLQQRRKNISLVDAYWSNPNKDTDFEDGIKSVDNWMFVGFFITREIVNAVGFPRKEFFIYYDDFEYADRITEHGYHIWKVEDSVIHHQDVASRNKEIKIFGKKIHILLLPEQKWKTYYLVRNELLRYKKEDRRYRKSIMRNIRRLGKAIIYNPTQLPIVVKGFYHGLIEKTGKIVSP